MLGRLNLERAVNGSRYPGQFSTSVRKAPMKTFVNTSLALGAVVMVTAGCTTTERTVGGALIGGAGGAVVGDAIGGSGGAVIGGLAGGTAGALVGRESGRRANNGYYRGY